MLSGIDHYKKKKNQKSEGKQGENRFYITILADVENTSFNWIRMIDILEADNISQSLDNFLKSQNAKNPTNPGVE